MKNYQICIMLFLICFIIGLPIYMLGCSDNVGGGCSNTYHIVKAKVIKSCHIYKKIIYNDDDLSPTPIQSVTIYHNNSKLRQTTEIEQIGYTYGDCRIKMSYDNDKECYLLKSDTDGCTNYIATATIYDVCYKENNNSYPIGSVHTIYVSKDTNICKSYQYVLTFAKIGFTFMCFSFICLIKSIYDYITEKYKIIKKEKYANIIATEVEVYNILQHSLPTAPPLEANDYIIGEIL